jgi:hypothetical protein
MRTLTLHFPDQALPALDTFLKQTKEARIFPPCPSRVRGRPRAPPPNGVRLAALYLFRAAQVGPSLRQPGSPRLGGSPPPRSPAQSDLRVGTSARSARRPRPPRARLQPFPVELSGTRHRARPPDRRPPQPRERPRCLKKKTSATAAPRAGSLPTPLSWRGRRSTSLPSSTGPAGVRSFCSMKMKPSSGVLPCPGRAGGAKPNARVCPPGH